MLGHCKVRSTRNQSVTVVTNSLNNDIHQVRSKDCILYSSNVAFWYKNQNLKYVTYGEKHREHVFSTRNNTMNMHNYAKPIKLSYTISYILNTIVFVTKWKLWILSKLNFYWFLVDRKSPQLHMIETSKFEWI